MEPNWSLSALLLVIWFQIILQCQLAFSNPTQDGHRHHLVGAHSQSQKPRSSDYKSKFKVKSVCFPLEFLDAIDLDMFEKWSTLEHHFQGQGVPKEFLLEENTDKAGSIKSRSFRSSDTRVRQKRRFPDHMNPAFHSFTFLKKDECPPSPNGNTRYFCPTKGSGGNHKCIEREQLCDDVPDCPDGQDETPEHCFFQRPMMAQMKDIINRLNMMVSMFSKPLYLVESEEVPLTRDDRSNLKNIRIEPVFSPRSHKVAHHVREETLDQIQAIQNMMDLKQGNHFLDHVEDSIDSSTLSSSLLEHLRGLQSSPKDIASNHGGDAQRLVDEIRDREGESKNHKLG